MTRDILFRAKPKDKETIIGSDFYYGDLIHYPNANIFCIRQQETGSQLEVIPETVGQFTGLTDKNGVKIFEGHKVKTIHGNIYDVNDMIEFHSWIERTFCRQPEFEVIGNIHDQK